MTELRSHIKAIRRSLVPELPWEDMIINFCCCWWWICTFELFCESVSYNSLLGELKRYKFHKEVSRYKQTWVLEMSVWKSCNNSDISNQFRDRSLETSACYYNLAFFLLIVKGLDTSRCKGTVLETLFSKDYIVNSEIPNLFRDSISDFLVNFEIFSNR